MRSLTPRDYTVGWICALPVELAAAKTMLDEKDRPLELQNPSDDNAYTLGRIGKHNVVIACLPSGRVGTQSAAGVLSTMKYTFGSIRFVLMVGIGGGVPSSGKDIRLGDIVVSQPKGQFGGVVQYDFGKAETGGVFVRTGSLNSPPQVLLTALGTLQADHMVGESGIPHLLSQILQPNFKYVGAGQDDLFNATYSHVRGRSTCDHCDVTKLIERHPRPSINPQVYYGTIASANQVVKDGVLRDRLNSQYKVLCFEMEAAGLMNIFDCLVIRGISDYADSHKNDIWKPYAAATAAAYAKELLSFVVPHKIVKASPVTSPAVPRVVSSSSSRLHTDSPLAIPAVVWIDDRPEKNQAVIAYARSLDISVLTLTSTSAARTWIQENLGESSK